MNYYEDQLKRINGIDYAKGIQFNDCDGNKTNLLDLNVESIPIIIDWLKKELLRLKQK